MDSSTTANAPAASTARASRSTCRAASADLALHVKSAERVDRLRRQTHVAHHRNFGFDQTRDQFDAALAAFHFHGFGAAFFHQAHGVANGFVERNMKAAVGHVGDEQRAARAAANCARVMQIISSSVTGKVLS